MPERERLYTLLRAAAALLGIGEAVAERVRLEAGRLLLEELYRFPEKKEDAKMLIEGLRRVGVDDRVLEALGEVTRGVGGEQAPSDSRGEPDGR